MIEIKAISYEQARVEHFRELMKKEQRKIDWWQAKARNALGPVSMLSRSHIECSEAGMRYSYYNDALEALENQPKWISVEEQPPEYCVKVQVAIPTYNGWKISTGELYKNNAWLIGDMCAAGGETPTHWMHLPSVPEEVT